MVTKANIVNTLEKMNDQEHEKEEKQRQFVFGGTCSGGSRLSLFKKMISEGEGIQILDPTGEYSELMNFSERSKNND